jgi:hypothetical protein
MSYTRICPSCGVNEIDSVDFTCEDCIPGDDAPQNTVKPSLAGFLAYQRTALSPLGRRDDVTRYTALESMVAAYLDSINADWAAIGDGCAACEFTGEIAGEECTCSREGRPGTVLTEDELPY